MEKKTMGAFLAALRKANGMTQKDLADRLNVSDKTVSRWECDDGAPDLSLIPVIAEIFEVTCDELLRGERRSPEDRGMPGADMTPKGKRQRQRILKATLSQYRTRTLIAIGISVAGLIAALICNLAFLRGVLGFLCGMIAFAASIFLQLIFTNTAFHSVEDAGLEEGELSGFRKGVIGLAEKSIGVTTGLFGFTVPLMLVAENAYMGLSAHHMLLLGLIGAGVFLLIYVVVCFFLNASLIKKGTYLLTGKEAEIYHHNHTLKKNCGVILAVLLLVTFLCHQAATSIWSPWSIMEGTTFDDYDSFVQYMEQDVPMKSYGPAAPALDSAVTYLDENGNEISEEEALTRTLTDSQGNVLCQYIQRNESVISVRYTERERTVLPITVSTHDDLQEAEHTVAVRNVIFGGIYILEAAAVLVFYFRKRAK